MKKRNLWLPLLLGFSVILGGCMGGSDKETAQPEYGMNYTMGTAVPAAGYAKTAAASSYAMDDSDYAYDVDEDVMEMEEAFYDEGYYDTMDTVTSDTSMDRGGEEVAEEQASDAQGKISQEKLVYSGSLTVETTAFTDTLARIKQTIQEMGGFIEWESDNDNSYGWYREDYRKSSSTLSSSLQVRIPSNRFQEFIDGIEGEGAKVTSRYVNVENISRRYSETALSIESYEIQERRLLEMMENAIRVSDMLEIEARLSEVQNSLKQLKNNLSSMDTDVAYSTVSIYLNEVGFYTQPKASTFGEKVQEAFSEGIESFVDGVQALALWLVRNFLDLIVFVVVLCIAVAVIKKLVARAKKKMAKKKPEEIGKVKE